MKQGWQFKKVGDIFEVTDYVANGSFATLRENVEYLEEPSYAVLVRLADNSNGFDPSKFVYVNEHAYNFLSKSKLFGGELIMSNVGSIGKVFKCPYLEMPMTLGPNAILIRTPNNNFYYYYFLSDLFQRQLQGITTRATLSKFNKTSFKTLDIPVPSFSEQQRIVDVLDAEFAKIDALKANAEKNLQNAKDLFKAALNQAFEPKKDWNRISLAEVCAITSKLVDPQLDEYRSLFHIGGANIESETGKLINLKTAEEEKLTSGKFVFNNATVLYNKIRPYLKKVARPDFNGLCSADMYPLTPSKGMSRDFLYYLLLTDDFTKYAIQGSARAGMPKVNRECLFAYECYVPSGEVQTEIAMRLDYLKDRCKTLQENYEKTITLCDGLKQALLWKAFNGDI